jgi:hypothetical protein
MSACSPPEETCLPSGEDILRATEARKIRTKLLAGEGDRRDSTEYLLDLYRNATNVNCCIGESNSIRDDWGKLGGEYIYDLVVLTKQLFWTG